MLRGGLPLSPTAFCSIDLQASLSGKRRGNATEPNSKSMAGRELPFFFFFLRWAAEHGFGRSNWVLVKIPPLCPRARLPAKTPAPR